MPCRTEDISCVKQWYMKQLALLYFAKPDNMCQDSLREAASNCMCAGLSVCDASNSHVRLAFRTA